jgi:GGDEF domain-containing protein
MGISMDELLESIRADPADAARLIVLASEIRKSSQQDDAQLSTLLTDYIEKASRSLSLDSKDVAHKDGIHLLKSTIGRIEADLVEGLRNHGIPQAELDRASQMLRSRLDGTVTGARREWANRFVGSLRDLDDAELLLMFRDLHQNENDTAVLREPFVSLLKEKNRSEEEIAQFFEKARTPQVKQHQELPKGVLNVNATLYFLEREIKRHQRYNTPFSCIIVTVPVVSATPGTVRTAGNKENKGLMPQILAHLRRVLRDLDIVGSLGLVSGDVPFIVLPMTEGPGAAKVVDRLKRELGAKVFVCEGERISGVFAISHASFDKTKMTGYRSFLELALSIHRKQEKEVQSSAHSG